MNYAKIVKDLRNKMLLTQNEFADFIGVSFESVNRWENKKNEPTMSAKRKIVALAKKYQIEME